MYTFYHIEYSIKHSKMLANYKQKYPYTAPFHPQQCEEICVAKNIDEDKSKFYVGKTLKELHCALYAVHVIEGLKK